MTDSQLYSGDDPVTEADDGFSVAPGPDPSGVDIEVDFDDEQFTDAELFSETEAGNAEGGQDAHLDDPERVARDDNY